MVQELTLGECWCKKLFPLGVSRDVVGIEYVGLPWGKIIVEIAFQETHFMRIDLGQGLGLV